MSGNGNARMTDMAERAAETRRRCDALRESIRRFEDSAVFIISNMERAADGNWHPDTTWMRGLKTSADTLRKIAYQIDRVHDILTEEADAAS